MKNLLRDAMLKLKFHNNVQQCIFTSFMYRKLSFLFGWILLDSTL